MFAVILISTQWVGAAASAVDPGPDSTSTVTGQREPLDFTVHEGTGLFVPNADAIGVDLDRQTDINVAARFEYGSRSNPVDSPAFTITNTDDEAHTITIGYDRVGAVDSSRTNLAFYVYDATGRNVATVTEESGPVDVSDVAPGATLYVVTIIDTHGLTDAASLSGTFTVHI